MTPVAELTQALMEGMGFTQDELDLNRNGQLSEKQWAMLRKFQGRQGCGVVAGLVIFLAVVGAVGGYAFLQGGASLQQVLRDEPTVLYVVAAVLGIVVLIFVLSMLRNLRRSRRLGAGEVSSTEGNVRLRAERTELVTAYSLEVGKVKFYTTKQIVNSFEDGALYRLYYIKNSPAHILLSGEALEAWASPIAPL